MTGNSEAIHLLNSTKKFKRQLRSILGFKAKNLELYKIALVHKSAAYKIFQNQAVNNERLEFLGDAILDSIIAEHLYLLFPDKHEGFLTQLRSKIVNRDTLKRISIKLGVANLVVARILNDKHKFLYGDALEAFIGAIYMDRGYYRTKRFVETQILQHHINISKLSKTEVDFKSRIIEWGQKNKKEISFTCREQTVEKETEPRFVSHLLIFNDIAGMGVGHSKKEAEQNAAKQALQLLE